MLVPLRYSCPSNRLSLIGPSACSRFSPPGASEEFRGHNNGTKDLESAVGGEPAFAFGGTSAGNIQIYMDIRVLGHVPRTSCILCFSRGFSTR